MSVTVPNGLRYRVVNYLEGSRSPPGAAVFRVLIHMALVLMGVPWRAAREIAYQSPADTPDLKVALRSMIWILNRSWIPLSFRMGTYFDIGWHLSAESCQALVQRQFISDDTPKRYCDLAQLTLSAIKQKILLDDQSELREADGEIQTLVNRVLAESMEWADSEEMTDPGPVVNSGKPLAESRHQQFDNERTKTALLDFDDLCKSIGLEYFLVSGTFLGAVRDGGFIGHDHDIDVGVFEDDNMDSLVAALLNSGNFVLNQQDYICLREKSENSVRYTLMDKPAIIRLGHKTGVSIDVFVHFYDGGQVWHGSSVHRWNNSRFELGDYEFLGRFFKGAVDFNRYLNENYGPDWRTPKPKFNVNFDTPNMSFVGTANALVFFAWIVTGAVREKNPAKVKKYMNLLLALGEVELENGVVRVK